MKYFAHQRDSNLIPYPLGALQRMNSGIIVGCFVIALFITPPDPLNMAILSICMWLLFKAGLLFGRLLDYRSNADGSCIYRNIPSVYSE